MSVLLALVTVANIIGALLKNRMYRAIGSTFIGNNATFISHLKFSVMEAMLMNRAKSVTMMSSEVFIKRLRQMNYGTIYSDEEWHNRVITATVYELRDGERWESKHRNGSLSDYLTPSTAMQQNSVLATSMNTTLWFTPEDKAQGKPQALMAAGQYTMCYNLLAYIEQIELDDVNLTASHQQLMALKPQLMELWQKFQLDPLWMVPKSR